MCDDGDSFRRPGLQPFVGKETIRELLRKCSTTAIALPAVRAEPDSFRHILHSSRNRSADIVLRASGELQSFYEVYAMRCDVLAGLVLAYAGAALCAKERPRTDDLPPAESVMARVGENQDRSEAERAHYVYVQHARMVSRRG